MSLTIALLVLLAQDVPAAQQDPEPEEVVVQATLGHTTMLFDKGSDGRLRNCRVMVSSGSQKRDTDACQATPVCYARTRDEVTECVDLAVVETRAPERFAPGAGKPEVFEMPQLVQPKAMVSPTTIGPADSTESRETERQRVKLPPLPKPPANEPVVRITTGKAE